jgi:hypothetical protein
MICSSELDRERALALRQFRLVQQFVTEESSWQFVDSEIADIDDANRRRI